MKLLVCLVLAVLTTACAERVDESKLRIAEVQLLDVEAGYRREVDIEFLDINRKMKFKETIVCRDSDDVKKLHNKIGQTFKVYDLSLTIVPHYFKLGDRFC